MGNGKIKEPKPPKAPKPPQAPTPPAKPADTSPIAKVKQLLSELRKSKKADPTKVQQLEAQIEALSAADLTDLEKRLMDDLDRADLKNFGRRLRNLYRFSRRNKQKYETTDVEPIGSVKVPDPKPQDAVKVGSDAGSVVLTTHSNGAYILEFLGETTDVYWVQFIWRMIECKTANGTVAVQKRITRGGRVYLYTSNAKTPRWTTDGKDPKAPFYEGKTPAKRTSGSLKIADLPTPNEMDADYLFDGPNPPTNCVSTFHAETYLVRRMEVLYRADVEITWQIPAKGKAGSVAMPVAKGQAVSGEKAVLRAGPRAALALQFPEWDYFASEPIGEPVPMDEFEPLSKSKVNGTTWPTSGNMFDRLKVAADLTNVKLIRDVIEHPDTQQLTVHDKALGPGLVFMPAISSDGESAGITGYVVPGAAKQLPALPLDRFGPLPDVAMLMGSLAFTDLPQKNERDKVFTLSVLRHEMSHAASNRTSIGWLIKWRDELTKDGFETWLGKQRIDGADFERALTFIGTHAKHATEALARTEGIVTLLPFLTQDPKLEDLEKEAQWPALLFELKGLLKQLPTVRILQNDTAVLKRIEARLKWCFCEVLDEAQRKRFIDWADYLSKVHELQPPTDKLKPAVTLLQLAFKNERKYIESMRKLANSCPKPKN